MQLFILAPSAQLDSTSIIDVANVLLNMKFIETAEIQEHLFSTSYEPPSPSTSRLSFTFTAEGKVMCEYYHRFLGLREKEASGTLLLGVFVSVMVAALTERLDGGSFCGEMEYVVVNTHKPGSNPATNAAVIAITTVKQPVILFEYKQAVDLRSG